MVVIEINHSLLFYGDPKKAKRLKRSDFFIQCLKFYLGAVDLSRLLLQQLVWYLDKAEYVTCSWLLEQTITKSKFQTSAAL
jgi:hypothetical protein